MSILTFLKEFRVLGAGLIILVALCSKGESADRSVSEQQAFEKAMADRMAFEKERAQHQIAQRQEDERRGLLRQQARLQAHPQAPQPPSNLSQAAAHQGGTSFASSLKEGVSNAAKSFNPHMVPKFQTDKPKEASLNVASIGDAALAESRANEASRHLTTHAKDRPTFKFNLTTDPLFVEANQVLKNPQQSLNEQITEVAGAGIAPEETRTCEESGDDVLETGEEVRMVTAKETKHLSQVLIYSDGWAGGLSRNVVTGAKLDGSTQDTYAYAALTTLLNPLPKHLQKRVKSIKFSAGFSCPSYMSLSQEGVLSVTTGSGGGWSHIDLTTVSIEILCKPGEEDVVEAIDGNSCQRLEEKVEKGLCFYENLVVTEGPQTRDINGYPVTRDWWRRTKVYRCHYPSKNDCGALKDKGCYQVNSTCKEKVGDTCVVWQQTYVCPSGKIPGKSWRASNKDNPFCLTGNCADTSYEANNELLGVMGHLYVLREAQNDLKNFAVIFKGQHRWCTRNCLSFRDCCGSGKGWGITLRLSSCDAAEIELRTLRDKRLCIQVGTYCAERDKVFGVCLRKKTSFCCYGTKIARLIQENGRAQLGMGFGTPESPDCHGLSPEQLSRIDFTRINFSELFEDIRNQTVVKGQQQSLAKVSTDRLQHNMAVLTKKPSVENKQRLAPPRNTRRHPESLDGQPATELEKLKEKGF